MACTKFNFIRLSLCFIFVSNLTISEMGTERLTSAKVSSSLQNKGEDKATILFHQLFQRYQQLLLKWRELALYRDWQTSPAEIQNEHCFKTS